MTDFTSAMKEKQTDEHGVIDEAYGDRGDASLSAVSSPQTLT